MKKLAILSMMALCLGFTACDEVEMADSKPQTHPQEAIFNTADMTFSASDAILNLPQANDEGTEVNVGLLTVENWPVDAYVPAIVMEVSADDTFAKTQQLELTLTPQEDNANVYVCSVRPDLLNNAYAALVTKDPSVGQFCARFIPEATSADGKAVVRIGGPDYYLANAQYSVQPLSPENVIEDSYVLVVSPNADLSGATEVALTNGGGSPYDDPVFSGVYVNDTEAPFYWAVKPASGSIVYIGGAEAQGALVEGDNYGKCELAGNVKFEVNMAKNTYKYFSAIDFFYTPSDASNWKQKNSQCVYTNDFRNYRGFCNLKGTMLFDYDQKFNNNEVCADGEAEVSEDGLTISGAAGIGQEPEIKVPGKGGLCWVTLDYTGMKYSITLIQSLGLIGSFNDWAEQLNMTASNKNLTWTSPVVHFAAGAEWKFRANDDWSINLGGDLNNLSYDGGNIVVEEEGDYIVTLDLSSYPYSCVVTKQ